MKKTAKGAAGTAKGAAGTAKPVGKTTVGAYLEALPPDRREAIGSLRNIILQNLPKGYSEVMDFGMICYGIPLSTYPDTYNGKPLCYLAIASQKNHLALYSMGVYGDRKKEEWLRGEFKKAGKKLDMGKSCIRFKSLDDLPLGAIGEMVGSITVKDFIAKYEKSRKR